MLPAKKKAAKKVKPGKKHVAKKVVKKAVAEKKAAVRPDPVDRRDIVLPPEITSPIEFTYDAYGGTNVVRIRPWTQGEIKKRKSVEVPLCVIQLVEADGDYGPPMGYALRKTVVYVYQMGGEWGGGIHGYKRIFQLWAFMSRQTDKRILSYLWNHDWARLNIGRPPWCKIADGLAEHFGSQTEWWKGARVSNLLIHQLPNPKKKPAKKPAKKAGLVRTRHG